MKDRQLPKLPPDWVTPVVAALLLGTVWLAAKAMLERPGHQRPAVTVSLQDGALATALTMADARVSARPLSQGQPDWLPPLSDGARSVLTALPPVEEGVVTTSGPAADEVEGPELFPAQSGPPPVAAVEELTKPTQPVPGWRPVAKPPMPESVPEVSAATPNELPVPGRQPDRAPDPLTPAAPASPGQDRPLRDAAAEVAPADHTPAEHASVEAPPPVPPVPQSPSVLSLPVRGTAARSEGLELLAREADMHSRLAFQLAGRGACHSAREQFIMALRLVAQGLDCEQQTTVHSRALAAGLTALSEAEDFIPSGSRIEADLDLATIIDGHRTPVLRGASNVGLTPLAAMQCYFTFAQEHLGIAAGREVAGSMALYGLGKLHATLARQQTETIRAAGPKAMAFYQASLLVDPRNYMASNELGVLLAQAGRSEDARAALEHSVSVCRQWESWQNLAKVYRQLGRTQLALQAEQQSAAARQAELAARGNRSPASAVPVQWVDSTTLAQPSGSPPAAGQPKSPQRQPTGWTASKSQPPANKIVRLPPVNPIDKSRQHW